ncbi:MAG: asparagine synthase (glutamine-hydrolyzing) [Rhodospirillales bacterium]|nr:asparagine synthase (glutamine-hydrolyzing) [Rhodospirillales bacterium]
MCGICGVFDMSSDKSVSRAVLGKMNETLSHRGPDDSGLYLDRSIGLGHRRLSVIDPGNGQQPFSNHDGTVWLSYNGEIYNHVELRQELVKKGHRFVTNCDTEVIVHAYEEYGRECVSKFNGMFSFALWDKKKNSLFIARDRLGIKPLYFGVYGSDFIFASEIKAILEHPAVSAEVELAAIPEYILCTSLLNSKTMFKNIHSVPPGNTMVIANGDIKKHCYWSMEHSSAGQRNTSFDVCCEEVQALLDSSIKMRVRSDVPFGTLLSGGLDSSLVSAMATRHIDGPLKTFSMGYHKNKELRPEGTDAYYAAQVASAYDTDHMELLFQSEDYFDVMKSVTWHVEKPVDLTSPSLFLLYKGVKPNVTVVTSGEGADELFAGYDFFLNNNQAEQLSEFPWAPYLAEVSTLLDPAIEKETGYQETVSTTLNKEMNALESDDGLNKQLYLFMKYYLVDMLERLDKTSMAWGVESRVPFLDHRLVEYVVNMPSSYKSKASDSKILLKNIATDMLPKGVVNRKKRPVPIPVDPMTLLKQRNRANELVQSGDSAIGGYFDKKNVDNFFKKKAQYASTDDLAIYRTSHTLIALDHWHRAFGVAA